MKKITVPLLFLLLFVFLSSCNGDRKMKGFTYEELAEYFSSVDGLTELGTVETVIEPGEYVLQEDGTYVYEGGAVYEIGNPLNITCGEDKIRATAGFSAINASKGHYNGYWGVSLEYILNVEVMFVSGWRSILGHKYPKIPDYEPEYRPLDIFHTGEDYLPHFQGSPNNVAYVIRNAGFNSSPDWEEWIDYGIKYYAENHEPHGYLNYYWYNPISEKFEPGACYTQSDDLTEIYVVFQEKSLFLCPFMSLIDPDTGYFVSNISPTDSDTGYFVPLLMSETKYNELKSEYPSFKYDHYKKGTVKEFSEWYMGEYIEEIPAVFADIEDEYVYYPAYGNGIHPDDLNGEEYDCDAMFIPDMKNLGVNFDELRSYIIKITIPHDGIFSDIYWELIG